jgi:hypothetical protein
MEDIMDVKMESAFIPRRTATGLLLLAIGLLLISLAGSASLQYVFSSQDMQELMSTATVSPLLTILNCLSPIGMLLQIIGLFVIAGESKKFGKAHERLAWLGAILYTLSLVVSLGVTIPLSLSISTTGSLSNALLLAWVSTLTSIIGFVSLLMVLYHLAEGLLRALIAGVAVLQGVMTAALTFISTSQYEIVEVTLLNQTSYVPQPYTGGAYVPLSVFTVILQWGMLVLVAVLAARYRSQVRRLVEEEDFERVV